MIGNSRDPALELFWQFLEPVGDAGRLFFDPVPRSGGFFLGGGPEAVPPLAEGLPFIIQQNGAGGDLGRAGRS